MPEDILTRIMREIETERTCPVCKEPFPATHIARVYCSQRCSKKDARKRARTRETKERLAKLGGRLALGTLEIKRLGLTQADIDDLENRMYPTEANGHTPTPASEPKPPLDLDVELRLPERPNPYEKYERKEGSK